jgi:hypothetical protein
MAFGGGGRSVKNSLRHDGHIILPVAKKPVCPKGCHEAENTGSQTNEPERVIVVYINLALPT